MMNYRILDDDSLITIREFLLKYYVSRSNSYKLIVEGKVLINNQKVKEDYILKTGDLLTLIDEVNTLKPYNYELKIIYEDDYLLIIDKPYGFIIHGDDNSVDNMVANYYLSKGLNILVRHIHRLDKETTGILVYAKDLITEAYFNHHLANHDFKRYYKALVKGLVKHDQTINKPIASDRHSNNKYIVNKNGKEAITHLKVLKYINGNTLVSLLLETGRTHQIRVHLKSINHPLLNDPIYNIGEGKMYLRSYKFVFNHPFLKQEIEVKVPDDKEE